MGCGGLEEEMEVFVCLFVVKEELCEVVVEVSRMSESDGSCVGF